MNHATTDDPPPLAPSHHRTLLLPTYLAPLPFRPVRLFIASLDNIVAPPPVSPCPPSPLRLRTRADTRLVSSPLPSYTNRGTGCASSQTFFFAAHFESNLVTPLFARSSTRDTRYRLMGDAQCQCSIRQPVANKCLGNTVAVCFVHSSLYRSHVLR